MIRWGPVLVGMLALAGCEKAPEPGASALRDTIALDEAVPSPDAAAPDTTTRDTAAMADTSAIEGAGATADAEAIPDTSAMADIDATPDTNAWTAGVAALSSTGVGIAELASVRVAGHDGFDRVVWELSTSPGVHVEYVDRPVRQCGSGEPVPLPGDGWLEVRLEPARAHSEAGRPTIGERRRTPGLPAILEIVQTCDFEAVVTWVLAVRSPEPFRLTRLESPPRIVVDVRHRRR